MKKFITRALSIILVMFCFVLAGCSGDGISSKTVLTVCQQYIKDLDDYSETISDASFVYPLEGAVAAATVVNDTDKSKFGIEYLNYVDFEFQGDANGHSLFSPKIFYPVAIGVLSGLSDYVDNLDKDTFKLNKVYKFVFQDGEEYFKAVVKNETLFVYVEKENYYE